MKKFRFKLDSVLTVRRFRKNQAAFALAEAQNKRLELTAALTAARQSVSKMEEDLLACFLTSTRAAKIIRHQNGLSFQRLQISDMERQFETALEKEDKCRDAVLVARQGEETLLRLREKEKDRHRREQEKDDERAVIDFVNASHHFHNAV